ncbi:MAG: hypothetical protein AAFU74_17535 [Bacteroidota bacterium]
MAFKQLSNSLFYGLLFVSISCFAQDVKDLRPPSIDDDDEIPVVAEDLPLPEEDEDYVIRYFSGITDGEESRIAIKNFGYILRPAMVQVFTESGDELEVKIVRKNWEEIERSGKTRNGRFENVFKTARQFGIIISGAKKGIEFIVAVSAGHELFPQSTLFVASNTMKKSGDASESMSSSDGTTSDGGSNTLLIILAVIGFVIILLLLFLVFRKRSAINVILALITFSSLNAGVVSSLGGSLSKVASGKGSIGGVLTNIAQNSSDAVLKFYADPNRWENLRLLTTDDRDYEPDMDPRGQPSLPSSCYETAQRSESRGSTSSENTSGGDAAKNYTGDSNSESDASSEESVDGKDENTEDAIAKAEERKERGLRQAEEVRNSLIEAHTSNFSVVSESLREQFNAEIRNAHGDANTISIATQSYQNALSSASRALEQGRADAAANYSQNVSDVMAAYGREMTQIQQRNSESSETTESSENDSETELDSQKQEDRESKKDPDREAQKDKDRDTSKGEGEDESKQAGDFSAFDESGSSTSGNNAEQSEGCECLERAYADFNHNRYTLEKLKKIGIDIKKTVDYGVSFGDNFSGIHAVSGLVWQKERAKILKKMESFDQTYTNKYRELIDLQYQVLQKIDQCEQLLGEENWYGRHGFMYYEFIKVYYASYK